MSINIIFQPPQDTINKYETITQLCQTSDDLLTIHKFIQDYFWNFKESLKVFKKVSKSCFQNFSHTWYHTCLYRIFVIHGEHKFLGNFQNFRNVQETSNTHKFIVREGGIHTIPVGLTQ